MMPPPELKQKILRTYMWRPLSASGCERGELLTSGNNWILQGTIIRFAEHGPAEVRYEVVADAQWVTRKANICYRDDRGERSLQVAHERQQWYTNEKLLSLPSDCADLDLAWSPSTNTLPIRRLNWNTQAKSRAITAAWVRLPELVVEPLFQMYERLDRNVFRYTSHGGQFTAVIAVDDLAIVNRYEGVWERITTS